MSNPSLTELLKEFDSNFSILDAPLYEAREYLKRGYELGVAEGQDKAIYAMDEEAKSHWFDAGKMAGVAEERARILKGLPEESKITEYEDRDVEGEKIGWNAYRQQVLALLEV